MIHFETYPAPQLNVTITSVGFGTAADMPLVDPPDGGWMDQWYYVAGVIDPDVTETISVYLSDGVTILQSASVFRDAGYATQNIKQRNDGYDLGVVRMDGSAVYGGGCIQTLDNVTLYDEPFDEKSFLVQVLGIPEPTSLAVLGLGGLLLARRRQYI